MPLPPVTARYLIEWLDDLGWAQAAGMGPAALSAQEVGAWCALTGTRLEPWEFEALRHASRAYCAQSASPDPVAPWTPETPDTAPAKPSLLGAFKKLAQQVNKD